MIEIKQISKTFGDVKATSNVSFNIPEACVFGLLGTNGSGKSTLIRMISGVLKPDEGEIIVDGEKVWENPNAKGKIFYISDDQYFFANATPKDMLKAYKVYYPELDEKYFVECLQKFGLNIDRKIQTFSKGMKKQLSILLGVCSGAKYLICDETFDGLDPVMRKGIKSIFANEMYEKKMTIIIASHNLRELEDICDRVGILHLGGVILDENIDDLKGNLQKIQCALSEEYDEVVQEKLDVVKYERRGKLATMIVRGDQSEIFVYLESLNPAFYEALPLSLEEIFINEMEVVGYDVKNLL